MKVMLINPLSDVAQNSDIYFRSVTPLPPLGLAYLAAVLRNNNIEVIIEDQYATRMSNKNLLAKIKNFSPDVIGFSCLTTAMSNVKRIINSIRLEGIDSKIILGNIHPTFFSEQILSKGFGDIVVRGEGEKIFLETVIALKQDKNLDYIEGISYICSGKVVHNPDTHLLENLDSLPYPDWHFMDLSQYRRYPMLGIYNKLVLPVQASRGCLYNCLFCSQDKFYKKPRYRNIRNVVDEIEYLYDEYRIKFIGFIDAYFPFSKNAGLEFCDELIKRKLHKKIGWFTETRVDMVDLELMRRMKEANLYLIMYGFEVGNQKVLNDTGKATTLEQASKAVEYTKRFNVRCVGLFMLGLPSDTNESCRDTINFAKKLDPDIAKFNIAIPFPGSNFFEENKKNMGDIDKLDSKFTSWYDWSSSDEESIYNHQNMTRREVVNLQRRGMAEFYIRPKIILKNLINRTFSFSDICFGGFLLLKNYLRTKQDKL